jgi:CBS domain containing-hemolysin-like protein
MTFTAWMLVAAVALLLAGLAACAAWSIRDFSRHDFEELSTRRGNSKLLGEVLRWEERGTLGLECAQLLAAAAASATFVKALSIFAAEEPLSWRQPAAFAAGAGLLVAVNIWIPWALARTWGAWFVFMTWPIIKFSTRVMAPLTAGAWLLVALTRRLAGLAAEEDHEETLEDEIRTIVTEGHREGVLEEDAREMIEGIMDLRDVSVSAVMTPRIDMVSMPVTFDLREAAAFVVNAGHSRIPVFDKHRDDIVGVLYGKDLLEELVKSPDQATRSIREIVRPPAFVPETKSVAGLLEEFQLSRNHMAVVLDEFAGVAGLITIEDILEEIVGEIIDEYDEDIVEGIRRIDDRTSEVLARVHVDEINERLGLDLAESGDFDTIGGFVFSQLGHLPAVGEQLTYKNLRITVLEIARRRIERIRIEILDNQPAPASPTNDS